MKISSSLGRLSGNFDDLTYFFVSLNLAAKYSLLIQIFLPNFSSLASTIPLKKLLHFDWEMKFQFFSQFILF